MKGFLTNDFVAPTNCIVLIKNLLEYIERRIELFISNTAIKTKIEVINNKISVIFFMFSYFITYVVLTTLSLPVALVIGLLSGFIFDLYSAIILISFASSFVATAAMLISRYLISDYINRKFSNEISLIDNEVNKHGAYYLFALRMSPVFPFFVINAAFGITKIKILTFYLISQLGMLPGTIIIILIGSGLNDFLIKGSPFSIDLVLYLTLLGLIPLLFKKYIRF